MGMGIRIGWIMVSLCVLLTLTSRRAAAAEAEESSSSNRKSYIVMMDGDKKPPRFTHHEHWYAWLLSQLVQDQQHQHQHQQQQMLYTYQHTFHGFTARLTPTEARHVAEMGACLAVFEDAVAGLPTTTRTPEFLGLTWPWHGDGVRAGTGRSEGEGEGEGVVVGVLDTGVWPESPSFDDGGMPPVPSWWNGRCDSGTSFNASHCNRKLIGARFFVNGYEALFGPVSDHDDFRSPRDANGHGTHTASIAAGAVVRGANLLGYATGTARGMASRARVAAYKVCWNQSCVSSDMLAAIDVAVSDGVHVLSVSIGSRTSATPQPYYGDPFAVGSLRATLRGVFVSCSAGNDGPTPARVTNTPPWLTTVAAATIDRDFPAPVILGDGAVLHGASLSTGNTNSNNTWTHSNSSNHKHRLLPLFYDNANESGRLCLPGGLRRSAVKGKVVLCDRGVNSRTEKGQVVRDAGGAAMILANQRSLGEDLTADAHVLPATIIGNAAAIKLRRYVNSTSAPRAAVAVTGRTVVGSAREAPVVAAFSSRGPNPSVRGLLKPDVAAPGVNILASWTGHTAPTELAADPRRTAFNIVSGTSMACPHVSGVAALLRAAHPQWSPAAVRSALMTTALPSDNRGRRIADSATTAGRFATPYAMGAGHLNPVGAISPGLVYELGAHDYAAFLCALNYTRKQMLALTHNSSLASDCTGKGTGTGGSGGSVLDLNYPSFSVEFGGTAAAAAGVRTAKRRLTSVAEAPAEYVVHTRSPAEVAVQVSPARLRFAGAGDTALYNVSFASLRSAATARFGEIWWECVSCSHADVWPVVRSPVAFSWT